MRYFKLPRIRVHLFGYIFSPGLIPTIATLMLLPVLISLGTWQLHRAQEKKQMERDFTSRNTPLSLSNIAGINDKNLRYRTLEVTGVFDNSHLIFLDNKTYHQKMGYHVFAPFYIQNEKKMLLIDRGFVPIKNRETAPKIPPTLGSRTIRGLIYFPGRTFILKAEKNPASWPFVLQAIDLKQITEIFHRPTYPFYVLLQEGDDANLIRDWHPVNFPSYRHKGYAIQWFSLALTLFIIYLSLNTSRANND